MPALRDCLESLSQSLSGSHELIVVDNRSTDSSVEQIETSCPGARIIRNPRNVGFAAACNIGAQEASGDYLVFLNPDVRVDEGAIEQLQSAWERHKHAGLAAARLRNPDGSFQPTCRKLPTVGNMLFSRGSFLSSFFARKGEGTGALYTLPDYAVTTVVPAVAATFVLTGRTMFNRAGGFDSRFFLFMEDTDLSLRLGYKGYDNLFVPSAGGVHLWGQGGKAGRITREWHHHVSVWKYFLKHLPNGFSVVILPLLLSLNFLLVCATPARRRSHA
jgi:GT2 family glycosyltransferase